jgi:arsenite methyltransferase
MDRPMLDDIKAYYGSVLKTSDDLQTNACCTDEAIPAYLADVIAQIAPEVSARYFGCGLVIPTELAGLRVLDLGSGAGRDAFVLSRLVGEDGSVVGVDMTREQLDVAEAHIETHRQRFGYRESNVRFVEGTLEALDTLGLDDGSFDLIVSNCVINLCQDKPKVIGDAWRLLRPGGELYFSDVYADRRVPADVSGHGVLYNECLGGALYWNDLLTLARQAGFADPRLVADRRLSIDNDELQALVGDIRFYSATYRLFKVDGLEPACEDYGQQVCYRGTVAEQPDVFVLDKHHAFPAGRDVAVSANTWRMLHDTRFARHFDFHAGDGVHRGIFEDHVAGMPFDDSTGGGCCG